MLFKESVQMAKQDTSIQIITDRAIQEEKMAPTSHLYLLLYIL